MNDVFYNIKEFYKGEMTSLRLIAEDLQTWDVITDDELESICNIMENAIKRMDEEASE